MRSEQLDDLKANLRREIIFGKLRPGERLVEAELSERFGVGRHVIRSAFDELERSGLVVRRPNRGATVIEYSRDEVEQLYEMRELLQREAVARIAMPVPRATIANLQDLNERYLNHLKAGELDEVVAVNGLFHRTLYDLCANRFLSQANEDHWQKSAAIHSYAIGVENMALQSHAEHEAIILALLEQDRTKLAHLCVQHMMPALEAYKRQHGGWSRAAG